MPSTLKRVAEFSLNLDDCIDGISTNAVFSKLLTIQRCRKGNISTTITFVDIAYDKLTIKNVIDHRLDRVAPNISAAVAISPVEDNRFATTTTYGRVLLWDLERKRVIKRFNCTDKYTPLHFHRSDPNIFAAITRTDAQSLTVFDIRQDGNGVTGFANNFCVIADFAMGQHSENRDTIAAVGEDGNVKIWDIRQIRKPLKVIPAHHGYAFSVDFSKTEKNLLVTGGMDKFIRVWNYDEVPREEYAIETPSTVGKVVWTNESPYYVCSTASSSNIRKKDDHSMYLWDVRRSTLPYRSFEGHPSPITDIVFPEDSSAGMCISACDNGRLTLHRIDQATIPMANIDVVSISCAAASNECVFAVPQHANNLDPKFFTHPENFFKPIKSNVFFAQISEAFTEAEKFKYLARRYKLICPLRENLKDLCKHNSAVAKALKDTDLAKSWELLGIIANDDIIAKIRPDLGKQFRSKDRGRNSDDDDETPQISEHEGSLHYQEDDFVEFSDLEEPDNEFVYDQEFFDFSVVLEEENCVVAGIEEVTPYQFTRRRNLLTDRVVNREQWFTGLHQTKLPSYSRRLRSKTVKRFKGALGRRFRGVSFSSPRNDVQTIKRTCVGYVFDNTRTDSTEFTSSDSTGKKTPLGKWKTSYQRRMSNRKSENNFPRPVMPVNTFDEEVDSPERRNRAKKRQREKNLAWIADNRIIAPPRAPVTAIHRIIIERSKLYRNDQLVELKRESKETETGVAEKKQNNFNPIVEHDQWPLIRLLFDYYMAHDDVQMVACMAMCIGERVTMIMSEKQIDRCFYYYVEQLERMSLFKEATLFMKANFRMQISQLNSEDTFVSHICEECNQPLKGPVCGNSRCRHEHFCPICDRLVHGQRLLCLDCGHGGHPEHMREWFERQDICPIFGCGHNCYPRLTTTPYTASKPQIDSSSRFHTPTNMLCGKERDMIHWRYKIPPH